MSAWGCPHDIEGKCSRVNNIPCDLGMKGCVLFGRFRFADPAKNRPKKVPANPVNSTPPPDDK
jgi:hypothetical protein